MKSLKFIPLVLLLTSIMHGQINTYNTVNISGSGDSGVNGTYTAISKNESGYDVYANEMPTTPSTIYLYRYDETQWVIGSTIGERTSGVYFAVPTSSVTPIGLTFNIAGENGSQPFPNASDPALPVELTMLSAMVDEDNVILEWITATEVNNYGFEIHRKNSESKNEIIDWDVIGFVEGYGNSNSPKNYSFSEKSNFSSGKYEYRLKQIDIDGQYEYSDIVEVLITAPVNISLHQNYPNPFNPSTTIAYSIPGEVLNAGLTKVILKVYDILGRELTTLVNDNQSSGNYSVKFDASKYSSGLYVYTLSVGNYKESKKMTLIK